MCYSDLKPQAALNPLHKWVQQGRMVFALRWNSRKSFTSLHCESFLSILSPPLGSLKGFLLFWEEFMGGKQADVGRLRIHWNLLSSMRCYNPEGKAGSLISGRAGCFEV